MKEVVYQLSKKAPRFLGGFFYGYFPVPAQTVLKQQLSIFEITALTGNPLNSDLDGKLKTLYSKKRINSLIDRNGTIQMIQNGIPKNEYFMEKIRTLDHSLALEQSSMI